MTKAIDEDELARKRTPEQREAWERLLKQAAAQGIKPMTKEKLDAMAGVWPEDESVDEFLEARERWRSESCRRKRP